MTDISNNHPYHFSVSAPKDSPYAKYDVSRPIFNSNRANNNVKSYARTPAEQAIIADGRVDVNDVGGWLLMGKKEEVDGLIEQLKSDGKLTEAEKVARIKEDFEKDWDLYLKNFTEWRNSDAVRDRDQINQLAEEGLLTPLPSKNLQSAEKTKRSPSMMAALQRLMQQREIQQRIMVREILGMKKTHLVLLKEAIEKRLAELEKNENQAE